MSNSSTVVHDRLASCILNEMKAQLRTKYFIPSNQITRKFPALDMSRYIIHVLDYSFVVVSQFPFSKDVKPLNLSRLIKKIFRNT